MFHWRDYTYFERLSDGSVRITKYKPAVVSRRLIFDITIPPNEWASIIATMSQHGESNGGWERALKFHNEV